MGITFGSTGVTGRSRAAARVSSTVAVRASSSRCLIVGNTSISSSRAPAARASAGRSQRVDALAPVDLGLGSSRRLCREEPGVEADLDPFRRDPAGERDELGRSRERHAGFLLQLADSRGGGPVVVVVHGAAGEHPRAAHEALLGVALHEQDLRTAGRVAQQDQGGRLARVGQLAVAPLLTRRRLSTSPAQRIFRAR